MSYLRRLAQETRVRFQPRRSRSFGIENALRVEESFVERPAIEPAEPGEGMTRPQLPRTTEPERMARAMNQERMSAAHRVEGIPLVRNDAESRVFGKDAAPSEASHRSQPAAMEVRRELDDAIVESVVFDPAEMQWLPGHEPARDTPDPRQAESVMARVRALTGQREAARQGGKQAYAAGTDPDAGRASVVQTMPELSGEVAASRQGGKRAYAAAPDAGMASVARTMPRLSGEVEVTRLEEPHAVRVAAESRVPHASADSRRESDHDSVQVSFGSIVIHVEPEPAVISPQPAPSRPAQTYATEADSRWMRSFLDRM